MTTSHAHKTWSGMLPMEDTALAVTDRGGDARPVLFLNGCYGNQSHWRKVIDELGDRDFRIVTFDERARGGSRPSSDYTVAACPREIEAVIAARALERPILVGWSYGAYLAVHFAALHPEMVAGVVCVDGAMPFGLTGEEGRAELRRLFTRIGWLLPIASRFGLAARMSATEHAEVNIEANELGSRCGPLLESLQVPVLYVLGTGGHLGANDQIMRECRATLTPVIDANPRLRIATQVPCSHSKILARFPEAIGDAVRELARGDAPV